MDKLTLIATAWHGKIVTPDDISEGDPVYFAYLEQGHASVVHKNGDIMLVMEEGRKFFIGLFMPRGWASPNVRVLQFDGNGRWDVLEKVEVLKGKRRKTLFEHLKDKYNF